MLEQLQRQTRRAFLNGAGSGVGAVALASLLARDAGAAPKANAPAVSGFPNLPVKAKRVIYLLQSGAPSQMDLFDEKPRLKDLRGTELPDSIRQGQRLTGMTAKQESFPIAPSKYRFTRTDNGGDGAWVSELLPYTASMTKDLAILVGGDQKWLTTQEFLGALNRELQGRMAPA